MNLDEAQTFVEMNSQPITEINKYSRCVDGRYEQIVDCPMIAKPGGDVGDVMVLFAALNNLQVSLPFETVLDIVVQQIGGVEHFNFHTDDHTEPADVGLGCEHFEQAKEKPDTYGLIPEQMRFINQQLPGLVEKGAHQEVLHGNHLEQAVIVVDSETYGVVPLARLGDSIRAAFIYQKTLHSEQLDQFAKSLQEAIAASGKVVEEAEVRQAIYEALGKQLAETLKYLAKGLPVYTAMIDAAGEVSVAS